jgi:nucleolar protein 14
MDRRFGENDPSMTPEERAAERFARESQRKMRKDNLFNLEEDDEEELELTHGGRSLSFGDAINLNGDDFAENDISGGESDDDEESSRKRKRAVAIEDEVDDMDGMASEDDEDPEETEPLRKKTKAEVMKEVIAKSKLYKYERQKAKEDDDDLRAELDKGLPEIFDLMRGVKPPPKEPEPPREDAAIMNPDRAALLKGKDRAEADVEYDKRLKQMAFDKRSAPTDRTKTEEEKAQEEAERLKRLELERLRRMRGDEDSESEAGRDEDEQVEDGDADFIPDDAKVFGLASAVENEARRELDVEDEDDFIIDDDLVDLDSNADLSFVESDSDMEDSEMESEDEGLMDDEFSKSLKNLVGTESGSKDVPTGKTDDGLAYTYPCPQSHEEFLTILKDVTAKDIPVIVQRIRALYHPRLHSDNKSKLAVFSKVLVDHVVYMANQKGSTSFNIIENLLRHIHSMAKTNSEPVAHSFRNYLREMAVERPLSLLPGDLVLLTGVMTVFPTSDHFHPVVTPANLCIARYLGQSAVGSTSDLATGAYLAALSLEYQTLAKRYMPEFMNYCLNALCLLSPTTVTQQVGFVLLRDSKESLRVESSSISSEIRKIGFWDVVADDASSEDLKISLISTFVSLLDAATDIWSDKSAFTEIFTSTKTILQHLKKSFKSSSSSSPLSTQITSALHKLNIQLTQSRHTRRPLLLHNHRPLAIKQSIPKFEEDFNPDKHYDPNRDRAELAKLRAEHKRERKGAMRELRKDANFVAREQLKEKKEKDAAYEKKYRRLIAEIQGEEGREAKAYEREKKFRQGKK